MKRIVILNFSSGEVLIRHFPDELENSEDWFDSKYNDEDIRAADCQWMVVDELIINSK
jgi:hypothetical protein